jgi:polysaccharide chain length determinant protein (PEP-CTERM system associated)
VIPGKQYTPELIVRIAWRRKWLIALPALLVAVAVAAWTHYLPDQYRSDTLILVVPQRVPESYVRSTVTTNIEDRLQAISQQILSRTRLESIIQDFNLYVTERKTGLMEDVVERMRTKDIQIDIVKGDAFRVSYTSDNPRTAMRVAERLASLFIDESLRDREVLAEGTNQFLESQLDDARRNLEENEKKLEEYRRKHDGELPTQEDSNLQGLHNTEMQLQALTDSLARDRDRHLVLERSIADARLASAGQPAAPAQAPAAGDNQFAGASAADQLQAAQAALQAMLLRLKPEHPDVVRLKRTIAELQKRADAEAAAQPVDAPLTTVEAMRRNQLKEASAELEKLDREIAAKGDDEKRLHATITDYQRRIEAIPTRESELAELTRDYETLQQSYRGLLAKKEDSQIAANLERRQIGEQFKVLDPARLPEKPTSPDRPRLYALGLAAAIAIGLAVGVLVEYLDRTMRSEDDVRVALKLPVLATIPILRPRGATARKGLAVAAAVVVTVALGAGAIAWRFLR